MDFSTNGYVAELSDRRNGISKLSYKPNSPCAVKALNLPFSTQKSYLYIPRQIHYMVSDDAHAQIAIQKI